MWKRRKAEKPEAGKPGQQVSRPAEEADASPAQANLRQAAGPGSLSGETGKPAEPSGSEESPQLSPSERVPDDMSSVALGGAIPSGSLAQPQHADGRAGNPERRQLRFDDRQALAGMDDAQVMLRVRDGDDGAFDYLVERYRRPMISFMFRMVHNAAIAEELAQEVFLRVYRSRSTYSADAKFTTWLYRIATNLAVNHARDTKHDRPEQKSSLDEINEETGQAMDVADTRLNVEQTMLRHERLNAIRQHVEALPERQKMAVMMHKYQELDYKQIADVLHLSESATKSLLFRAYETLRQNLREFI
jgi:RNA polymerase sigma-70 factor, ECF subfamily